MDGFPTMMKLLVLVALAVWLAGYAVERASRAVRSGAVVRS